MKNSPPRWLERLLERFLDPHLFNGVYGDLVEAYNENIAKKGTAFANWIFFLSTLGFFRYFNLLSLNFHNSSNSAIILLNYCKTSTRNLARNKENTAISLIGLIVSFIASIAIFQYTNFENSYDQFNPDHNRIYRVSHNFKNASSQLNYASTFYAVQEALEEIPEIEVGIHFSDMAGVIKKENELFPEENFIITSPEYFKLFGVKILEGNVDDLADPSTIMLSQKMAQKYFGNKNAIGESLEVRGVFAQNWMVKVSGVFEDIPPNSHIKAELIIPSNKLLRFIENGEVFGQDIPANVVKWRWLQFHTYVKLHPNADLSKVTDKANEIVETNRKEINAQLNQEHSVWLQPISSIHTTTGIQSEPTPTNDIRLIHLFNLIGMIILLIAWINYINITTARAVTRSKEVGIRKILGSHKSQLRVLFLLEAFILNASALVLALLILRPIYPIIEELVEIQFFTGIGYDFEIMRNMVLSILIGSLLSGLYPAFVLSGYQPIQVLKGKMKYSLQGVRLRRILVVLQLVFSLFLISSLFIVQRQMDFMANHSLGIALDQTIVIDAPAGETNSSSYMSRLESLQNELENIPGVFSTTVSSMVPGIESFWRGSTESRNGEEAGIFLHRANIDEDYMSLYGLNFIAGRNFDRSFGSDKNAMIVNELTAQNLGFNSPEEALNEQVYFTGEQSFTIIGVVNNFYQRGVQFAFEPRTFQLDTARVGQFISIKFETTQLSDLNRNIEAVYSATFPGSPFNSRFLDEVFQTQYDSEKRFRNLFTSFTAVALVVACLGLIGLASYLLNQKNKEVSIRKVLGAKNSSLFLTLNKEYLVISIISFLVTLPLIIYLMQEWLNNYANRIDLELVMFIYPFLIILSIILLITLRFTLKVISANPAVVLREDG